MAHVVKLQDLTEEQQKMFFPWVKYVRIAETGETIGGFATREEAEAFDPENPGDGYPCELCGHDTDEEFLHEGTGVVWDEQRNYTTRYPLYVCERCYDAHKQADEDEEAHYTELKPYILHEGTRYYFT